MPSHGVVMLHAGNWTKLHGIMKDWLKPVQTDTCKHTSSVTVTMLQLKYNCSMACMCTVLWQVRPISIKGRRLHGQNHLKDFTTRQQVPISTRNICITSGCRLAKQKRNLTLKSLSTVACKNGDRHIGANAYL